MELRTGVPKAGIALGAENDFLTNSVVRRKGNLRSICTVSGSKQRWLGKQRLALMSRKLVFMTLSSLCERVSNTEIARGDKIPVA